MWSESRERYLRFLGCFLSWVVLFCKSLRVGFLLLGLDDSEVYVLLSKAANKDNFGSGDSILFRLFGLRVFFCYVYL